MDMAQISHPTAQGIIYTFPKFNSLPIQAVPLWASHVVVFSLNEQEDVAICALVHEHMQKRNNGVTLENAEAFT